MRLQYSALCVKANGKLRHEDPTGLAQWFAQIGEGQELTVYIEEVGRKHTRAQEKFFHGPVLKAFVRLGWTKAEAKTELCLKFIPRDHRRPDGTIVILPGSTSPLEVEEYNALIDSSIQLAAEMGEVVQDGAEWRAQHQPAVA